MVCQSVRLSVRLCLCVSVPVGACALDAYPLTPPAVALLQAPTLAPSQSPSSLPTAAPTLSPSAAPTNQSAIATLVTPTKVGV